MPDLDYTPMSATDRGADLASLVAGQPQPTDPSQMPDESVLQQAASIAQRGLKAGGDFAERYVPGVHGFADAYRFLAGTPEQQRAVAAEGEDQFQHPYRTAASGIGDVLLAAAVPGTAEAIQKGALKALVADEAGGVGTKLPGMGTGGAASKAAGSIEPTEEIGQWLHGDFAQHTAPRSGNMGAALLDDKLAAEKAGKTWVPWKGYEGRLEYAGQPELWTPRQQLGETMMQRINSYRTTHGVTTAENRELTKQLVKMIDKEPNGWDLIRSHYRDDTGHSAAFEQDFANATRGK